MKEMPKFISTLKGFYKKNKRDLPWRHTHDPYKILVSEIMLQQTQASRVVGFYNKFTKQFPTANALAKAPLSEVLKAWQGLGYNRRAKFLHEASRILSGAKVLGGGSRAPVHLSRSQVAFAKYSPEFWESLPGVGHYTARAVIAFAFNKPSVFIETNIRTVFTYFFFSKAKKVDDKKLLSLIEEALKKSKMRPRDFYAALMDYGSYLKANGIRINSRSKHYIKQSKFEGSKRQKRAARLRRRLQLGATDAELEKLLRS